MDKLTAGIKADLLQHLLRATQGTRAAVPGAPALSTHQQGQLTGASPLLTMTPAHASTQINLPPALRQLLAEHAQLHHLLPRLQVIQSTMATSANTVTTASTNSVSAQLLSAVLPLLTQQLAATSSQLGPQQLRQFVSQWFSFHPGQALSSPAPPSTSGWVSQLGPLLQWLLVQRSAHQPLARLLQQSTPANTAGVAGSLTPPTLAALSSLLLGSMQDIRLSQVHLADTSGQQQPEYYLVLPYQVGDKSHVLEWLLRKQARSAQHQESESWKFSLRFETQSFGPILVKGVYTAMTEHGEGQPPLTQLRFYLHGEGVQQKEDILLKFEDALANFTGRLTKAGIGGIKHDVHFGVVPTSLAPTAHELVKTKTPQKGPYG